MFRVVSVFATVIAMALPAATPVGAQEKVGLTGVHMCCEGCADEVAAILGKVRGVTGVTTDEKTKSATFTAADAKVAQSALDALAAGGFHGNPGTGKGYAFRDDSGVKPGTVKALTVTGFHNSCAGCVKSFREAIKGVKGVTGDNARSRVRTAEVTGEFDPTELVRALNAAGFHVKTEGKN